MELVEAIEAVAEADGAAGWCVMIASTTSSMSCFLEPAWAEAIYADPRLVTGGALAPTVTDTLPGRSMKAHKLRLERRRSSNRPSSFIGTIGAFNPAASNPTPFRNGCNSPSSVKRPSGKTRTW